MKEKHSISIPAVGAGSLLATFAVLCLVVFALLSLSTVQAEKRLADAAVQAVTDYYAADFRAEQIFARLRRGELPAEVMRQENVYTYKTTISEHQYLLAELEQAEDGWRKLRWQTVSLEEPVETETLPVWNGEEEKP